MSPFRSLPSRAAGLLLLALGAGVAAPAVAAANQQATGTQAAAAGAGGAVDELHGGRPVVRYAVVVEEGARMLNLPDVQGLELARIPANTVVAIHRELDGGWLEVDLPGGFPVWASGRFLRGTDREEVLEVTGSRLNMRPRPNNEVNNYAIPEQLRKGDRVALIELADPSQPLNETWAKLWSPPGAGAYLKAENTRALTRAEKGPVLWMRGERALASGRVDAREQRGALGSPAEATAGTSTTGRPLPAALAALEEVRAEVAAELDLASPDFEALRSRLGTVLELDPDPLTRKEVERELEFVDYHAKLFETRKRLEEERLLRRKELVRRQQQMWELVREKDPQFGRFDLRGRLERIQETDGERVFRLWRGTEPVAELVCGTGRYDLELFVGCELGIAASPLDTNEALESEFVRADVGRIEVLSIARVQ